MPRIKGFAEKIYVYEVIDESKDEPPIYLAVTREIDIPDEVKGGHLIAVYDLHQVCKIKRHNPTLEPYVK